MVNQTRSNFPGSDPFDTAKFSGDSGFCSESNLKHLHEEGIDAYITDLRFRQRDERLQGADGHYPKDFMVDPITEICTCPAGKKMWLKSRNAKTYGMPVIQYQAHVADCKTCSLRSRCWQRGEQKSARQFTWFKTHLPEHQTHTKRMKRKIDTDEGRYEYSKRLGIIEPVFANITSNLKLNRFSLRGKLKVTAQWLAFCLVHNIWKIQRYGTIN